ncbi:hypothetical protein KVT40_002331 [Elsinoe batatas]|uniref:Uncharacterized protein n=1 Tax=Elsinoe batatas TaxID=2601811 RepID=A0A8K0L7N2_9PEZI|nr:hypothetical protein KVT40_002331 [Elsinoe batatas]
MARMELEDILWYSLTDCGSIFWSVSLSSTLRMALSSARGKWLHMLRGGTVALSFRRV